MPNYPTKTIANQNQTPTNQNQNQNPAIHKKDSKPQKQTKNSHQNPNFLTIISKTHIQNTTKKKEREREKEKKNYSQSNHHRWCRCTSSWRPCSRSNGKQSPWRKCKRLWDRESCWYRCDCRAHSRSPRGPWWPYWGHRPEQWWDGMAGRKASTSRGSRGFGSWGSRCQVHLSTEESERLRFRTLLPDSRVSNSERERERERELSWVVLGCVWVCNFVFIKQTESF